MQAALGEQGSSLWLRTVPEEGVGCESSAGSVSWSIWAAHHISAINSQSHGEMWGTEGNILRKETPALFLCNAFFPWKGRYCYAEWHVYMVGGVKQEWGKDWHLFPPLHVFYFFLFYGWVTKSLAKKISGGPRLVSQVDSDWPDRWIQTGQPGGLRLVSLLKRLWLMGNLSLSFFLSPKEHFLPILWEIKLICPSEWKLT